MHYLIREPNLLFDDNVAKTKEVYFSKSARNLSTKIPHLDSLKAKEL